MQINLNSIREHSWEIVCQLKLPINLSLPILDGSTICRSTDDIVDRIIAMLCAAAVSYGFDPKKAMLWLKRESLNVALTSDEEDFLLYRTGDTLLFKQQIEGLWALAWSGQVVSTMDFMRPCGDNFAQMLPDLKNNQSSEVFRQNFKLRSSKELIEKLDLAYCMHWSATHLAILNTKPKEVPHLFVLSERHRALEWLFSNEDWLEVDIST